MDHSVMESQAHLFHDVKLMLAFKPFLRIIKIFFVPIKTKICITASTVCVYILFFSWNDKKKTKVYLYEIMMPLNFSHLATIPELCSNFNT